MTLMAETIFKSAEHPNAAIAAKIAKIVDENWHDPAYRNSIIMALQAHVQETMWVHRHELQAIIHSEATKHSEKLRRGVMKAALSKRLQTVTKDGWSPDQARLHPRGASGRFGESHVQRPQGPSLVDEDMAAQMSASFTRRTEMGKPSKVKYTTIDKDGKIETHVPEAGKLPDKSNGRRVLHAENLGIDEPTTIGDNFYNVGLVLSGGDSEKAGQAGYAGAMADGVRAAVKAEGDWGTKLVSNLQMLDKLGAGKVPQAKAAIEIGKVVGQYGPEATQVLGPHARRARYRYTGVVAGPAQIDAVARSQRQDGESTQGFEARLALNLAQKLPTKSEHELLLKTGGTAPSEGYLLNKDAEGPSRNLPLGDNVPQTQPNGGAPGFVANTKFPYLETPYPGSPQQ